MLDYSPRARYEVASNLVVPRKKKTRATVAVVEGDDDLAEPDILLEVIERIEWVNAAIRETTTFKMTGNFYTTAKIYPYGLPEDSAGFSVRLVLLDSGSTISLIPYDIVTKLRLQTTLARDAIRITITDRTSYLLVEYATAVIYISRVR